MRSENVGAPFSSLSSRGLVMLICTTALHSESSARYGSSATSLPFVLTMNGYCVSFRAFRASNVQRCSSSAGWNGSERPPQ